MSNKKFLPLIVKIIFPKKRTFKNEAHRANETAQLGKLVGGLDYRVAGLN